MHSIQRAQLSSWKSPIGFNNFYSNTPVVPRHQQMPLLSDNPLLSPPLANYLPMTSSEQLGAKYFCPPPPLLFQSVPDTPLGLYSPVSSEDSLVTTQLELPAFCPSGLPSNPTARHIYDTALSSLVKPEDIFPLSISDAWANTFPSLSPVFDSLPSEVIDDEDMKDANDMKQEPSPPQSPTHPASVYEESDSGDQPGNLYSARRSEKDQFLIDARAKKMTYKEIREIGGFTEAESTLRGRYRTLTKSRHARVRRPHWTQADVSDSSSIPSFLVPFTNLFQIVCLEEAVKLFCNGRDPLRAKIPWKKVAEYIQQSGGTYLFGPATCKKKWETMFVVPTRRGYRRY